MAENADSRRMVEERPDGGFRFITVRQLLSIWRAYRDGKVTALALRVYFAVHEMAERRHAARADGGGQGAPSFTADELQSLVGRHPEQALRRAVRELEREGLLVLRRASVQFAPGSVAGDEMRAQHVQKRAGGSQVPVPRHVLKYLAAGLGRADVATILAHQIRGLFRKRDSAGRWLCHSGGACKASWVAEAFGVDARSVKRSRRRLEIVGLLLPLTTDHWHRQRYGGWYILNLHWSKPVETAPGEESARSEVTPRCRPQRERLSPPDSSNTELPAELEENQKPATRRPAGATSTSANKPPNLRDVKPDDLRDTERAIELHAQACRRWGVACDRKGRPVDDHGRVVARERAAKAPLAVDSEAGRLAFLALIEHARAHGDDPVRHFMGNLLQRRWHHVTQADEDAALEKLRRFRNASDPLRRAPSRQASPRVERMTRSRWLEMSPLEQIQWKLEERRRQAATP